MACPYFMPTEKLDASLWPHPQRLPLGAGWRGQCTAANCVPNEDELKDHCNLGYPRCAHVPPERAWDSVRFSVVAENGTKLVLCYVCEKDHLPAEHGRLDFDPITRRCERPHSNACLQRMAECYAQALTSRCR